MLRLKAPSALLMLLACAVAHADFGSIQISSFPELAVADSRSTVTITAAVRVNSGKPAPNGTRVTFQTTLGHFQETAVTTVDGYARAVLVTSGAAGTAKITASAISLTASATTEVEFVSSRNELSSANLFVDIETPRILRYSIDDQIVQAAALNHGIKIRFGKITVDADDMQFNVSTQELRAKRAKVTAHGKTYEFRELDLYVSNHRAFGTTTFTGPSFSVLQVNKYAIPVMRKQTRFGLVQLMPSGDLQPVAQDSGQMRFDFDDISLADSYVTASRATIFPGREIQFQRAQLSVQGTHIMSLALYRYDLTGGPGSLGEQIVTVNNNKIGVNYPYYLSLNPGTKSLLRFTTGQSYGRSFTGNSASLINYEMSWSRTDGSEGGMNLTGINRPDWSLDIHHSFHFDDGSSLTALASSPLRRSLFGSIGYSKPLKGFQWSINDNANKSLVGPRSSSNALSSVLESDPHKVHKTPLTLYYGLTASDSNTKFHDSSQHVQNVGVRLRGQFDTFQLDKATSLSTNFSVGQQWGTSDGIAIYGAAGLSRAMPWGSVNLNYDYSGDNTLSTALSGGRQRMSLETNYQRGRTDLSLLASRSLDANWSSLYGDLSYRVSGLFRFSTGYSVDQYLSDHSLDYNVMFSYRIGVREVGLVWSRSTHRLGFEILGARF